MQHNPTHSQKESNTLKVYHTQSTISSFYDMSAPIQFTLSYCSGLSDKDFFTDDEEEKKKFLKYWIIKFL